MRYKLILTFLLLAGIITQLLAFAPFRDSLSSGVPDTKWSGAQGQTTGTAPADKEVLICVIPIKGPIMDRGLPHFIKRAVEQAKEVGAKLIIFEINTPGGAVSIGDEEYTMGIVKGIENSLPVTSVAYVANAAISAGVLISIACDKIIMQPDATIGAAEVIVGSGDTPHPHQAKYTSAFEAIMKAKAEKKGYPYNLVAAMVNRNLAVHQVKINNSQIAYLTEEEIKQVKAEGKDIAVIKRIGKPDEPLTLTASEAKEYGLISAIVSKRDEIPGLFGIKDFTFREMEPTWSEDLVIFLTNPLVSGILIMVGLIAVWMSFKAPGMGVPETLAVVCFLLIFFGHYLAGLAEVTEALIFFLGLALLAVEVFIIPGFGVTGIAGIILILVSLVLSMQDFTVPSSDLPWQWRIFWNNLSVVIISSVSAMVIFIFIVRLIPYSPYLNRLVLKAEETSSEGFTSSDDYHKLIGSTGIVLSYLRPAGKIRIGEELIDVVTEGEFIEQGKPVKVIKVEGNKIIVEKA
ncbi:MAG: nodulation protein NfeD [Planctomycetes bacterium]|nr:nodulation protein NfeD [Planctomycetota bacterium]